jgi:hypothetical protein
MESADDGGSEDAVSEVGSSKKRGPQSPKRQKKSSSAADSSGAAGASFLDSFKVVDCVCSMCSAKASEPMMQQSTCHVVLNVELLAFLCEHTT